MNCSLPFLTLCTSLTIAWAEPGADFLRFSNGDTLHGQYQGLDEGPLLRWQSSESEDPIHFETRNLRKLSLNNGRSKEALTQVGLVTLSNGDLVPGNVLRMDEKMLTLETEFAGVVTIPREHIVKISPNRHGGNVLYAGPFNDDNWSIPKNSKDDEVKGWSHGSAAWYSQSSEVLRLDTKLPDKVSIRFELSWQAPLNATIGLFSDFLRPEATEGARIRRVPQQNQEQAAEAVEQEEAEDGKPAFVDIIENGTSGSDAGSYGSGYLISILSSYTRLQRLDYNEERKARKSSFPNSGGRLNLGDLFSAEFEIRADREEGTIALFVDGNFFAEWQDLASPLTEADRYFGISAGGKARLRLSDVVVSEWNGMPDSARSMETEERDVALLANGTDRISGKILGLQNEIFEIESSYGAFQIPVKEVTNIQMASNSISSAEAAADDFILVSFQPKGLLTLRPKEGQAENLRGEHPILGPLDINLKYVYLLEFDPIATIFDNWDDEF